MVCYMCHSMSFEDENHFLLECLAYTHNRFKFHNKLSANSLIKLLVSKKDNLFQAMVRNTNMRATVLLASVWFFFNF